VFEYICLIIISSCVSNNLLLLLSTMSVLMPIFNKRQRNIFAQRVTSNFKPHFPKVSQRWIYVQHGSRHASCNSSNSFHNSCSRIFIAWGHTVILPIWMLNEDIWYRKSYIIDKRIYITLIYLYYYIIYIYLFILYYS